jgi:acetyl-CoA carboxylase carboxyl transferase subunit beta
MGWFIRKKPNIKGQRQKSNFPTGLWKKCDGCDELVLLEDLNKNLSVCPRCKFHYKFNARKRINFILDEASFIEFDKNIKSENPLQFVDKIPYSVRINEAMKKTAENDAFISGYGTINGNGVQIGSFNFEFMGGSMGAVVGEKVTRLFERSLKLRQPSIIITSSGGARMQEGAFSLMQMAKTSAALQKLETKAIPYWVLLTDPTTGGVAASFAMLGDLILAEPNALIGFAGPRVIEQTIKQALPKGFQRSEFLLKHGFIDSIVERGELRNTFVRLTNFFQSSFRKS